MVCNFGEIYLSSTLELACGLNIFFFFSETLTSCLGTSLATGAVSPPK